ncbi:MAG: ACT domain-containing protein [Cellvibrionales bacterium]|jgi:glycine cleavage system regulatory protein
MKISYDFVIGATRLRRTRYYSGFDRSWDPCAMQHHVVTFVGPDRTGVVEDIAQVISDCDGNWLESRLSRLDGQFAGLVLIAVATSEVALLESRLAKLDGGPWHIHVSTTQPVGSPPGRAYKVSLVGPDRPGIVSEISGALAGAGISIQTLESHVEGAPFSGEPLFSAVIEAHATESTDAHTLFDLCAPIADAMGLDLEIEAG